MTTLFIIEEQEGWENSENSEHSETSEYSEYSETSESSEYSESSEHPESTTLNDTLQGVGVAILLILAIGWIIVRMRRKPGKNASSCDCGCSSCPLYKKCDKPSKS